MNRNQNDSYGHNQGSSYHTHRSEQYRHPERHTNKYDFDDYGSSARGGYGNESYSGRFGNQGNEMGGSRNISNYGLQDTYSTSQNYGNMGSYGGSQGFGTSRGGYSSQRNYDSDTNYNSDSGMGSSREARDSHYSPAGHRSYGYQSDYDSHGRGSDMSMRFNSDRNLYGNDTSRRFQGSSQGNYDFDRDNFDSPNYGGSEGSYMGSGYSRTHRGDYSSSEGNYNAMRGGNLSRNDEPYGLSGYYSGGYGSSSMSSNYIPSRNQSRTFDHEHDREYDRDRDRNRHNYYDRY